MNSQKVLGFFYVQYRKSSTSTMPELLTMVCRDVKLCEDILEVFLYLLIRDLIGEIPNEHLHHGRLDQQERVSSGLNTDTANASNLR